MQLLPKANTSNCMPLKLHLHPWTYCELERVAKEADITVDEAADQLLVQALKLLRLNLRREERRVNAKANADNSGEPFHSES
jgi:hypothetical protein